MDNLSAQIYHRMTKGLAKQVYELERDVFSKKYEDCPKSFDEYRERRLNRELVSVVLLINGKVIGARLFEAIDSIHFHSLFMAINESHRGRGFGNLLCMLSIAYLKWRGIKYISSWTHIDIQPETILAKFAPLVSRSDELTEIELSCRKGFEQARKKKDCGTKRKITNFYKMVAGSNGDANFWVHQIL